MRNVGLVFAGGCLGTLLRWSCTPLNGALPYGTFAVNVVGAFLLAALLARLAQNTRSGATRGSDRPETASHLVSWAGSDARLFLGTGLLGAFTTYSALSVETVGLLRAHPVEGIGYAVITVLLGLAAAWLGNRVVRA